MADSKRLCINLLDPKVVPVFFEAKLRMFDLKSNFKRKYKSHLFKGTDGLHCPQSLKDIALPDLTNTNDTANLTQIGFFS